MTVEHSDIQFGEMHPVANWVVTSGGVAALGSIPVGDGDIGKQAWVAGVGHYTLAATNPVVWEASSVTISSFAYNGGTGDLTITLSSGYTLQVTIPLGLSTGDVNGLISSALATLTTANIPPSADRNYVTDAQLTVVGNTSGTNSGDETQATIKTKLGAASSGVDGYITGTDWNTFNSKEPTIASGTSAQYIRGDKTLATLNADAVPETASRVYLSPAQKTVATQAATAALSGYLSSTDWTTFNSKQAALADVITANTYGSSTQYPVITFNAKGIATGVTLQTMPTPTFTDATFSVQKNGSPSIAATWSLSALTASRVHTYPNKAIDFGTLSSVGASDGNSLSGTRTRILGGSSNVLFGTDTIAIGCSNNGSLWGMGATYIALHNTGGEHILPFPKGTAVLGTSLHPVFTTSNGQSPCGGALATTVGLCTLSLSANGVTNSITTDAAAQANTNTPRLIGCGYSIIDGNPFIFIGSSAVHDVEFIVAFDAATPLQSISRTFYAKRRVYVAYHAGTWANSIEVVGTDTNLGTVVGTVTVGFTLDTTNNRLVPTVSATGGQYYQASVRVNSHYNNKV